MMVEIHTTNPLTLGVDTRLDKYVAVLLSARGSMLIQQNFLFVSKDLKNYLAGAVHSVN